MESILVFVYNADSGIFNGLLDWAHKIFSPQTYACNLCAITYDNLGMRRPWRDFLKRLPLAVEFLHRDELRAQYGIEDAELPAAYRRQGDRLELWISAAEINACRSLEALQELIASRVSVNHSLTKS